ncbi:MAG: hypothetical protein ACK6D2_19115, partial [Planctomycetota bacterium]
MGAGGRAARGDRTRLTGAAAARAVGVAGVVRQVLPLWGARCARRVCAGVDLGGHPVPARRACCLAPRNTPVPMTSRLAAARPNRPPHRSSRRRKSCAGASLRTLLPGFGLLVLLAQAGSAQSAPQRPADPARAAAGAAGAARDPFAESNQGTGVIGPGGGVVGTPDGEFEVEWAPNAARRRTRAIVAHDGDPEVKGFGIDGPPGPVIVRWFPPRAILPAGPEVQTPTPPTPPPTPPPDPVVIIEEGNGEWREVEPQPSPKGGKQIRIEDDLAPIRAVGGIAPAFRVAPDRGYVRVKERIQFQLVGLTPRPRPQPIDDDELAPLPKR